ncbi:hypothetical protein BDP27DRAFT_1291582 [Rhodocollybia butyracea]|uniref:BTB domain-containing protein n=1 Tax=Rhodocollybia butyracea TaxID=206335 RepID=A0A9P5Q033_9AGAR|nr:hypothetical protein BDP27DRAFT_1291582 [Rhodocollybia butyracea]
MRTSWIITRGDPWFEDGNIILVPQEDPESSESASEARLGFRVHRGVLARHSEVFQDMFELPQPDTLDDNDNDNEVSWYEGCQVISMYDIPIELSNLVKALYDGPTFQNRSVDDFFYLAGILRLATKYLITHLRSQAIKHLTQTWSYNLKGHDNMLELALRTPLLSYSPDPTIPPTKLSYPFIHPLHVLNFAISTNVRIIIPSALYFLSLYPLEDLLRADHPKLQVKHPSKPSSALQPTDLVRYTLMFQRRLDAILEFINTVVGEHESSPSCTSGTGKCKRNFQRLATRLSTSWVVRTGPFNFIAQAISQVNQDTDGFCTLCREEFAREAGAYREKIWAELPAICGLPSWDAMKKEELS